MIEIRAPIPVSVRLLTLSTRPLSVQDNAVGKRGGPTYRLLQPRLFLIVMPVTSYATPHGVARQVMEPPQAFGWACIIVRT